MPIRAALTSALRAEALATGTPVVVGVSGGVDSMVLSHALAATHTAGVLVHVNYGLRPSADADAELVAKWAETHVPNWPLVIHEAEPLSGNTQEAARSLRYALFHQVAQAHNSSVVMVAHHQRDQVETLLLHLLRGTGPRGLAGMPGTRSLQHDATIRLVRPLLQVSRAEIESYADEHGVPYRTDPTNESDAYMRNRIRHEVLPVLTDIAGDAEARIADTAALMRDYVDQHLQPALTERFDAAYTETTTGGRLVLDRLRAATPVIRTALIRGLLQRVAPHAPRTQSVARAVADLVEAQVGRRVEVRDVIVWRTRDHLEAVASAPEVPDPHPVSLDGLPVALATGTLRCTRFETLTDSNLDRGPHQIVVDAAHVHPPVTVRPWRDGDRMRPLGMDGHKSVSDILTDAHVPPPDRNRHLVVEDTTRIVWAVGHCLHHAVRVTASTNEYVIMQWKPGE